MPTGALVVLQGDCARGHLGEAAPDGPLLPASEARALFSVSELSPASAVPEKATVMAVAAPSGVRSSCTSINSNGPQQCPVPREIST